MDVLTNMIEHYFCKLLEENAVLQEFLKKQTVDVIHEEERELSLFLENLFLEDASQDAETTFLRSLWSPPLAPEVYWEALPHNFKPRNRKMLYLNHMATLIHPFEEHSTLSTTLYSPVDCYQGNHKVLEQSATQVVSTVLQETNARFSINIDEKQGSNDYWQMLEARVHGNPLHVEPRNPEEIVENFLHVQNCNQLQWMPRDIHSVSQMEGNCESDDKKLLRNYLTRKEVSAKETESLSTDGRYSIQEFDVPDELINQKVGVNASAEKAREENLAAESKDVDDIRQEVDRLVFHEADLHFALHLLQNMPQHSEANILQDMIDLDHSELVEDFRDKTVDSCSLRHQESSHLCHADVQAHSLEFQLQKCFNPVNCHVVQTLSECIDRNVPMGISPRKCIPTPDILRILLPPPIKFKQIPENPHQRGLPLPQLNENLHWCRDIIKPTQQHANERIQCAESIDVQADTHIYRTRENSQNIQCTSLNRFNQKLDLSRIRVSLSKKNVRLESHLDSGNSNLVVNEVQDTAEATESSTSLKHPSQDQTKSIIPGTELAVSEAIIEKTQKSLSPTRSGDLDIVSKVVACSVTLDRSRALRQEPHQSSVGALSQVVDPSYLKEELPNRILCCAGEESNSAQLETLSKVDFRTFPDNPGQIKAELREQPASIPQPFVFSPTHLNDLRTIELSMLLEMHRVMNPIQVCGLADLVLLSGGIDVPHDIQSRITTHTPQCRKTSDPSSAKFSIPMAPTLCQFHDPSGTLKVSVLGLLLLAGGMYIVETLGKILWCGQNHISAADTCNQSLAVNDHQGNDS